MSISRLNNRAHMPSNSPLKTLFLIPVYLALCNAILAADTYSPPSLSCVSNCFEFGTVADNQQLKHVFTIRNQGGSVLLITKLHNCCGASTKLADATIPPGTFTTLEVGINMAGRKGRMNKSIYLHSNDPSNSIFQIRIMGVVVPADSTNAPPTRN